MTFLQPWILMGLPLMALPILIHLINQRRHKTVHWGAMQFLLSAKKMSKGMARLRHWLIMAARVIAIAALVLAIGRPLATGWLGTLAGGKPETVILLLDRSPSMQHQILETGESKIGRSLRQIVDTLKAFGGAKQIVLIESTRNRAYQLQNPEDLLDFPETQPTDCTANIPAMMQSALDYISENQTGRTDIWLCSDSQAGDWRTESDQWKGIQQAFSQLEGIRFQILDYREAVHENRSIVVQKVERLDYANRSVLSLDLMIQRSQDRLEEETIDIGISIAESRSIKKIHFKKGEKEFFLNGFQMEIDRKVPAGWGVVDLPADSNPSDNQFFFAFSKKPTLKTIIVSENPKKTGSLNLLSSIATDSKHTLEAKSYSVEDIGSINWNESVLLLWHAPLPNGTVAAQINQFIDAGKIVVFFPPKIPGANQFAGAKWTSWTKHQESGEPISRWERDEEILRPASDGSELPLDEIKVYEYCSLKSDHRKLASLQNGKDFLTKAYTENGGVYFCTTLPDSSHSTLAQNGLVLYAMIQRCLLAGSSSVGMAKSSHAGTNAAKSASNLKAVSDRQDSINASEHPYFSGVYGSDQQLLAINRSTSESSSQPIPVSQLETLFQGLDFHVISAQLTNKKSLASEVWKYFIVLVGLGLLTEAILCLPPKPIKRDGETVYSGGLG